MIDMWSQLGPTLAALMFFSTLYRNYIPQDFDDLIAKYIYKVMSYFKPYVKITFPELETEPDGFLQRSKVFAAIQRYLSSNASTQATSLLANEVKDSKEHVVFSMDDYEEVIDEYEGIKLRWSSYTHHPTTQTMSWGGRSREKRFFVLKFHKKHLEFVKKFYLKHVVEEGKMISIKEEKRKLYTNNKSDEYDWYDDKSYRWSHVIWKHPSTFETMALEPKLKQEILDDLITFSKAKDYYKKIGKAWKRGYLLYGPPGTGKSSIIAAMANLMQYDLYDIELTAIKDNSELRKLLIDTSSKSIIVIEDIDCSIDLTGNRNTKEEENSVNDDDDDDSDEDENIEKDPIKNAMLNKTGKNKKKSNKVTLSGLLNFMDGLWSAIGEERIMVFTTNYVERLDPALIRRGRMDMHIELSYCCFEAFKVLAKNYIDVESHLLFPEIQRLLEETKITPADVAENLMPKSAIENADAGLQRLIKALETAKEEATLKTKEENKPIAEEDEQKDQN